MNITNVMQLLIGVSLFLFGMSLMGEGLKKVAGKKLETVLYKLAGSRIRGIIFGTGVTLVIQSSSAASIMAVSFANTGIMNASQAIPVVLGSILGTSITGWIISLSAISGSGILEIFSSTGITCITAVTGIYLKMFTNGKQEKRIGTILLGFATLMLGMSTMSGSVSHLKNSPEFEHLIIALSNPLFSVLVGLAATAILQSSSATVGILQALSFSGLIRFSTAFPMLLGIAVGAAVPVIVSGLGAKQEGKVTAFSYLIMAAIGSVFCAIFYYVLNSFLKFGFADSTLNTVTIAVVNTLLRLFIVITVAPLTDIIGKRIYGMHKETDLEKETQLKPLEEELLKFPELAIVKSSEAINHMSSLATDNVRRSLDLIYNFSKSGFDEVQSIEESVDRYEDKLGTYLLKLTGKNIDKVQNTKVGKFLHTITDFERMSDHAVNLSENAQEIYDKKLTFSDQGRKELDVLLSAVKEVVAIASDAFISDSIAKAKKVEPLEDVIDDLIAEMKAHHIARMQSGSCPFTASFAYNDILTNCERIADHCSNIAVAIISIDADSFDTHQYLDSIKHLRQNEFEESYELYAQKYHFD